MPVTRGALRRLLAVAVAASLLAIPAAVSADRPFEYSDHSVGFDCFIEDESTITFTGAWSAEEWGATAWLHVMDTTIEDPEVDPTILFGYTDDVTVTDDGTNVTFSATIPLFEPGDDPEGPGEPAGEAILQATLVPDGPPYTLTSSREGNRQIRQRGSIQPMAVTGTLTLPGDEVIALSGDQCFGQRSDIEVWQTNPRAFVDHRSGIFASCFWETDDGFAAFYAESGEFGTFADAMLLEFEEGSEEPTGGLVPDYSVPATVTFTTRQLSASMPMLTYPEGDPAGTATADATVTTGEPETFTIKSQYFRSRIKGTPLFLDGSLVFPTGETFAFAEGGCFAVDFRESLKSNPAQGPKPGGKAPANDDPSGAITLRGGSRLNVQTGGAAWEPEVEASCAPIGTTLWYTIEGTGGPITVDTAGSGFDTVAAVYTSDGSVWEEVACVDDVPVGTIGWSYQSAVTWDSVAGQTYYVQLGGFGGEFGRLRVAVY